MKPRTVLQVLAAAVYLLLFASIGVVSARHGMGMPYGSRFFSIPSEGPYYLDNHGQLTEVDRGTYAFLEWGWLALMTLSLGGIGFGLLMRWFRHKK